MPALLSPEGVYIGRSHSGVHFCMEFLYGIIDKTETSRSKAAFNAVGDFNNANLRKVLLRYHQHISCPTLGENTLDHVYTPFRDRYKALAHPPFGKSDHVSVLRLPSYRQEPIRLGCTSLL